MARMHRGVVFLSMLSLVGGVGCQYALSPHTGAGFTRARAQPPEPQPSPTAAPEPERAGATAGADGDDDTTPEAVALQEQIEAFVARFPDSELARRLQASETADADVDAPGAAAYGAAQTPAAGAQSTQTPAMITGAQQPVAARPAARVEPARVPAASGAKVRGQPGGGRAGTAVQPAPAPEPEPAVTVAAPPPAPIVIRANAPMTPRARATAQPMVEAAPAPDAQAPQIEAVVIEPVQAEPAAAPGDDPAAPNQALAAEAPANDVASEIAALEQAVAERPNDLHAIFRLRMLYFAEGFDDKATAPTPGLDPEAGALLTTMASTLASVRDAVADPFNRSSEAIAQAEQLIRQLRRQAPVRIDNALLVNRVSSFGDYDEVAEAAFPSGAAARTILYTEVSNFRSEPTDDGTYRTLLGERVEVYDANGEVVLSQAHDKIPDECRRVRSDFFLALELAVPATLPPGDYTIKVTIEDKLSATADQAHVPFTMLDTNAVASNR